MLNYPLSFPSLTKGSKKSTSLLLPLIFSPQITCSSDLFAQITCSCPIQDTWFSFSSQSLPPKSDPLVHSRVLWAHRWQSWRICHAASASSHASKCPRVMEGNHSSWQLSAEAGNSMEHAWGLKTSLCLHYSFIALPDLLTVKAAINHTLN